MKLGRLLKRIWIVACWGKEPINFYLGGCLISIQATSRATGSMDTMPACRACLEDLRLVPFYSRLCSSERQALKFWKIVTSIGFLRSFIKDSDGPRIVTNVWKGSQRHRVFTGDFHLVWCVYSRMLEALSKLTAGAWETSLRCTTRLAQGYTPWAGHTTLRGQLESALMPGSALPF